MSILPALYVSVPHVGLVPAEATSVRWIFWNRSYGLLWATVLVLGIKPGPLKEQLVLLTACWTISSAPESSFWYRAGRKGSQDWHGIAVSALAVLSVKLPPSGLLVLYLQHCAHHTADACSLSSFVFQFAYLDDLFQFKVLYSEHF